MKPTDKNILSILKNEPEESIKRKILGDLRTYSLKSEDRKAYLQDIIQHGCQSGMVTDLIYYSDTVDFYDKYESEIWDLLEEQAEVFGKSIFEMIGDFNGSEHVTDIKTFKNLLAWYAYEEKARELLEQDFEIEF